MPLGITYRNAHETAVQWELPSLATLLFSKAAIEWFEGDLQYAIEHSDNRRLATIDETNASNPAGVGLYSPSNHTLQRAVGWLENLGSVQTDFEKEAPPPLASLLPTTCMSSIGSSLTATPLTILKSLYTPSVSRRLWTVGAPSHRVGLPQLDGLIRSR